MPGYEKLNDTCTRKLLFKNYIHYTVKYLCLLILILISLIKIVDYITNYYYVILIHCAWVIRNNIKNKSKRGFDVLAGNYVLLSVGPRLSYESSDLQCFC